MRYAIIVAGGSSARFGKDKLNEPLVNKSVLQHSVDVFKSVADEVVVVGQAFDGVKCAKGGDTRFQSVLNGFAMLSNVDKGVVAIHDGARPFITRQFAMELFEQAEKFGSAIPTLPVTDTVYCKQGDKVVNIDRNTLFTVQTPQVFDVMKLAQAIKLAKSSDKSYTDESTLFSEVYGSVHFVEGLRKNAKITYSDDLPQYKVGVGFDVHAFESGDGVILGGVKIPYNRRLKGHSDADALCHAICDSILSASGNKDIGHQFPDSDPRYKGADSTKLLRRCVEIAAVSGFEVVNVSAVVVCQEPKIAPYVDEMAAKLSTILNVPTNCVNITATTTERLGALGNGDGIAVTSETLLKRL